MTPIQLPGSDLPDNLPLLTQVVDEGMQDDLPTLTEVVAEEQAGTAAILQPAAEAPIHASCTPNEEEMQRLLQRIETHLENAFAYKLSLNLERLQRQAIEQAVGELKAELPELLREMLNTYRPHP